MGQGYGLRVKTKIIEGEEVRIIIVHSDCGLLVLVVDLIDEWNP